MGHEAPLPWAESKAPAKTRNRVAATAPTEPDPPENEGQEVARFNRRFTLFALLVTAGVFGFGVLNSQWVRH
jgi:hypothetical protein